MYPLLTKVKYLLKKFKTIYWRFLHFTTEMNRAVLHTTTDLTNGILPSLYQ